MIDARKFWTMCRLHDWHYHMSDDPEVYRDGRESEERLLELAEASPEHSTVYGAWYAYHYENGARPEEPKLEDAQ